MTDDDAKELQSAIRLAKVAHDRGKDPADGTVVILGALIRAVELLAKRFAKAGNATKDAECRFWKAESENDRMARSEIEAELDTERAQYEATIELQKQRIAELEKDVQLTEKLANASEERAGAVANGVNAAYARIEELEKRIAETTTRESELHTMLAAHGLPTEPKALSRELAQRNAPMVVDGKTPGQVADEGYAACDGSRTESWEAAASAVLRAFGNGAKTKEALQRVREKLNAVASFDHKNDDGEMHYAIHLDPALAVVDAEIANIEWVKA
jgi:leucyl aminopeptidase (aminopeptidase T)